MERFKKYFTVFMIGIVFLVAVVATLGMTNKQVVTTKSVGVMNGKIAPTTTSSMRGVADSMTENYGAQKSFPEMTGGEMTQGIISSDMETQKKEIKNGNLSLRVGSADSASEKIYNIARENMGEVFSSTFTQADKNIKNGNLEVRVPVANFEKTFKEIKGVASLVIRENTSGQDVTMAYADLQTQLKNKQVEEQAFLDIFKQAGKISDILEVTQEVARVRGEIESLQGQIAFMDSRTDMATINVSLTEDTSVAFADKWRPTQVAKETINMLFRDMQGFVDFMIVLTIRVIPIMFLYGLIVVSIYFIARRLFFRK